MTLDRGFSRLQAHIKLEDPMSRILLVETEYHLSAYFIVVSASRESLQRIQVDCFKARHPGFGLENRRRFSGYIIAVRLISDAVLAVGSATRSYKIPCSVPTEGSQHPVDRPVSISQAVTRHILLY